MGEVRAEPLGLAASPSGADRILTVVSLLVLALLSVPRVQVAAGVTQSDNALVEHLLVGTAARAPRLAMPSVTEPPRAVVAVTMRHPRQHPRHRNKHGKKGRGRGKAKQRGDEQMTDPASPRHSDEQRQRRRQQQVPLRPGQPGGKSREEKGRGRERGTPQQIRHRKRRRRPRRKGAGAGALSGNDTARHKSELVGRRTLEVLATSSPQGRVVGILDIPAVPATTPGPPVQSWAITKDPHLRRTTPKSTLSARGRKRADGDNFADDSRPLDPDWLQRLLTAATVGSARSSGSAAALGLADTSPSPCERWLSCSESLRTAIQAQLTALPACPCTFPANVFYYNKIWDRKHGRYFRWRDASGGGERLDIYHPGATYCIRSLHTAAAGILSAQHCCYDRHRRLLTRGSGAGTPALVSPDVSAALHDTLDVRPWRVCKGDFTRYNELRPPNNGNQCTANPDDDEFLRQTESSQFYR